MADKFKNFIDPKKLKEDIVFSDVDLDSAMIQQASLYVYYGTVAAQAMHQADTCKSNLAHTEAKVAHMIREEAAETGRKVTENMVKEQVIIHPDFVTATKRHNDARMIAEMTRNALEAFKQRRDMLVQIGKRQLGEMQGGLSLDAKSASGKLRQTVNNIAREANQQ